MKKVVMLFLAVVSTTAAFAKTGEVPVRTTNQPVVAVGKPGKSLPKTTVATTTPASHQALAEVKAENAVKALRKVESCTVTVSNGTRSVTASGSCDCTQEQACDIAYAVAKSRL